MRRHRPVGHPLEPLFERAAESLTTALSDGAVRAYHAMILRTGARLGPYEILAPAGAGGMGEVYKARDTRLDRMVAIKVLANAAGALPAVRQRFEREARAVSAINHPHICSLFDIGQQDGIDYLVLEFLEGETLAERLRKGALPIEHALRLGIQIAGALEAAHGRGIIHRDLKPANIILTASGAKVLDFGLAKMHAQPSAVVSDGSILQTLTTPLTGAGPSSARCNIWLPNNWKVRTPIRARTCSPLALSYMK